ncbi:MAG: hypothetical protein OXQ26_03840 [bacterium]|nr:hypothetical protein [bacterium]
MNSRGPSQNRERANETLRGQLTPRFMLVFSTVVALTLLALALNVLLALFGGDSDQVRAAADVCSTTYKMGFGAIVGLMTQRVV